MEVYLPIAEMSVNGLLIVGMGATVGFLSGLFGVGGGFMMTPMLIFLGIPPAVAVATQANQLVAASLSGALAHWRRRNVDVKMGLVMLAGGAVGSAIGVWLFRQLQEIGQIDLVISLLYVGLLGFIGTSMFIESLFALVRRRRKARGRRKLHRHAWFHGLPLRTRFPQSRLYISALVPATIGLIGGMLVAVMGIGGGFLLVPAMIYLLDMPIGLVAGTSLFQIIFTTAATTVMQAAVNHTVDVMLALLLLAGGAVGVQFGTRVGSRMRGDVARILLSVIVVAVSARLAIDLVGAPVDRYAIDLTGLR